MLVSLFMPQQIHSLIFSSLIFCPREPTHRNCSLVSNMVWPMKVMGRCEDCWRKRSGWLSLLPPCTYPVPSQGIASTLRLPSHPPPPGLGSINASHCCQHWLPLCTLLIFLTLPKFLFKIPVGCLLFAARTLTDRRHSNPVFGNIYILIIYWCNNKLP